MEGEGNRARLVAAALVMTENTAIALSRYELELLDKYVHGVLTIEEVIILLQESEVVGDEPVALTSGTR
jgi:hypothetical protein